MIVNWDLILNDLSVRLKNGTPDFKNEQHIIKLWDVLKEHNWPIEARVQLIQNLNESEEWWTKMSPEQQADYIKKHPKSQKAQDAKEKEKGKEKEDGEKKVDTKQVEPGVPGQKDKSYNGLIERDSEWMRH